MPCKSPARKSRIIDIVIRTAILSEAQEPAAAGGVLAYGVPITALVFDLFRFDLRVNSEIESTVATHTRSLLMYPEIMVIPMREELTRLGIEELRTPEAVDQALAGPGTTMVVVNSICGCAAGRMRPAVRMALEKATHPDHAFTVFAGQDQQATECARGYFAGQPPSSPSIAILRDGQLVYMMARRDIESREAPAIAADLKAALDKYCARPAAV
jgi:putative YphP/YqiW family bacilliredoxin